MSTNRQSGIAVLETAGALVVVLGLLTGVLGLVDYLERVTFIGEIIEREVNDSSIKPFRMQRASGEAPPLEFDQAAILQHVTAVAAAVEAEFAPYHESKYRVEARYARADIDPQTGIFLGFRPSESGGVIRGSLAPAKVGGDFTNLDLRFSQFAAVQKSSGSSAMIAIPSGTFGMSHGAKEYLDGAVLIGVRAFLSLKGTLAGFALEASGADPEVYAYKVMQLRGVVQ